MSVYMWQVNTVKTNGALHISQDSPGHSPYTINNNSQHLNVFETFKGRQRTSSIKITTNGVFDWLLQTLRNTTHMTSSPPCEQVQSGHCPHMFPISMKYMCSTLDSVRTCLQYKLSTYVLVRTVRSYQSNTPKDAFAAPSMNIGTTLESTERKVMHIIN